MNSKRKFKMPDTFILIIFIALVACLLTWIVPGGAYARVDSNLGGKVVDPNSFTYVPHTPVNPLSIPMYVVNGFKKQISLLLCMLFGGGAFRFVAISHSLESLVASIVKRLKDKTWIIIPIVTGLFALLCTSRSLNAFIPFAGILVAISVALGYDAIVGVAMLLLGGGIGFSTGTLSQSTTLIAQTLSGLSPFSGIGYRAVCLVVFYIVSTIYLVRYANTIRKDPTRSVMYGSAQDVAAAGNTMKSLDEFGTMTLQKWIVLLILVATLGILVVGSLTIGWQMDEFAVGFLWCAIAMGVALRMSPSEIVKEFFNGAKGALYVGSLVCAATAISLILSAGGIIDTIVHALTTSLNQVPYILQGPALYLINTLVNVLITSGSGQAAVVIPITAPVEDMIGMSRQTMVLAYNLGDGLSNYILPTAGSLMGILGMGNVPYDKWMKFMWKLFLIWMGVACVMMMIAQAIHYA